MNALIYSLLGMGVGIFAGFFGLGGGVILIPLLIYCFGLTQHQAQGTSLAIMIPPIGLLAALSYYYAGNVKLFMAGFICAGFFIGGLIGATLVHHVPDLLLKRLFGVVLLFFAVKMILGK